MNPKTDPFFFGDPCTSLSSYTPSEFKPFIGECCIVNDDDIQYEITIKDLCEVLSDGVEVPFCRVIKTTINKKTGETTSIEATDYLSDMVTEYSVVDETNVAGRPEKCSTMKSSGVVDTWEEF